MVFSYTGHGDDSNGALILKREKANKGHLGSNSFDNSVSLAYLQNEADRLGLNAGEGGRTGGTKADLAERVRAAKEDLLTPAEFYQTWVETARNADGSFSKKLTATIDACFSGNWVEQAKLFIAENPQMKIEVVSASTTAKCSLKHMRTTARLLSTPQDWTGLTGTKVKTGIHR